MMAHRGAKGCETGVTDVTIGANPLPTGPTTGYRRPAWVAHVLDDAGEEPHAVLLHLPRGERVALSGTATRVWQLIVAAGPKGTQMGDVVPILTKEYRADPTIISRDVAALLAELLAGEWVEIVDPNPSGDTRRQFDERG